MELITDNCGRSSSQHGTTTFWCNSFRWGQQETADDETYTSETHLLSFNEQLPMAI